MGTCYETFGSSYYPWITISLFTSSLYSHLCDIMDLWRALSRLILPYSWSLKPLISKHTLLSRLPTSHDTLFNSSYSRICTPQNSTKSKSYYSKLINPLIITNPFKRRNNNPHTYFPFEKSSTNNLSLSTQSSTRLSSTIFLPISNSLMVRLPPLSSTILYAWVRASEHRDYSCQDTLFFFVVWEEFLWENWIFVLELNVNPTPRQMWSEYWWFLWGLSIPWNVFRVSSISFLGHGFDNLGAYQVWCFCILLKVVVFDSYLPSFYLWVLSNRSSFEKHLGMVWDPTCDPKFCELFIGHVVILHSNCVLNLLQILHWENLYGNKWQKISASRFCCRFNSGEL